MSTKQALGRYVDKYGAAEFLGVEPRTIEKWTGQRKLPFVRLSNRCVRYDLRELDAMMDRLATPVGGEGMKAATNAA